MILRWTMRLDGWPGARGLPRFASQLLLNLWNCFKDKNSEKTCSRRTHNKRPHQLEPHSYRSNNQGRDIENVFLVLDLAEDYYLVARRAREVYACAMELGSERSSGSGAAFAGAFADGCQYQLGPEEGGGGGEGGEGE